jgi:hypothetical protein
MSLFSLSLVFLTPVTSADGVCPARLEAVRISKDLLAEALLRLPGPVRWIIVWRGEKLDL